MAHKRIVWALAMVAIAANAQAQRLNLVTAYENALDRNLKLREYEAQTRAKEEGIDEAWSSVKPQVQLTTSYGTTDYRRNISFQGRDTERDRETHRRIDFTIGQVLYSKQAFEGIDEAQADKERTLKEYYARASDLQLDVVKKFLDALKLKRQLAIAESELESHERKLQQVKGLKERGFASRAQILEAKASIDEANAQVMRLRNDAKVARSRLRQHTGTDFSELAAINESQWKRTPELLEAKEWQSLALENAASIELKEATLDYRRAGRDKAQGAHYPELHLRARYTDNDTFATNLRREARVELELSLPIYKGGGPSARRRAAQRRVESAEYALEHEQEKVLVDLNEVRQNLEGSYSNIKALKASQESAQAALEEAESGFNAGIRELSAVLDARRRASQAKRDLVKEIYTNLFHQFELRLMAGQLNRQQIIAITQSQ